MDIDLCVTKYVDAALSEDRSKAIMFNEFSLCQKISLIFVLMADVDVDGLTPSHIWSAIRAQSPGNTQTEDAGHLNKAFLSQPQQTSSLIFWLYNCSAGCQRQMHWMIGKIQEYFAEILQFDLS